MFGLFAATTCFMAQSLEPIILEVLISALSGEKKKKWPILFPWPRFQAARQPLLDATLRKCQSPVALRSDTARAAEASWPPLLSKNVPRGFSRRCNNFKTRHGRKRRWTTGPQNDSPPFFPFHSFAARTSGVLVRLKWSSIGPTWSIIQVFQSIPKRTA